MKETSHRSRLIPAIVASTCALGATESFGQWVSFTNQTATRLIADPTVGVNDVVQKNFAWGDFDHDGDTDLVNMRRVGFEEIPGLRDALFMNEGVAEGHLIDGVLVDRTVEYGSAADDGGQGMLDLARDRDVVAVDVNGDGWLDLVTAPTFGQGLPKSMSHPRVYLNLKDDAKGAWLGFRYEQARIPQIGAPGQWPNFFGVGAGDVTGDKLPDLYFVDVDNVQVSALDDRLLINDGNGFFADESSRRMTPAMLATYDFGISSHIADFNGDGDFDILDHEDGPVQIHNNDGAGYFTTTTYASSGLAYETSVGDLNGDGKVDIVVTDDGLDRYLLNTTAESAPTPAFASFTFPQSSGFGGTSRQADLNHDGFIDVLISDIDAAVNNCTDTFIKGRIYRSTGGPTPAMVYEPSGIGTNLDNVHDFGVIDVNRDGWLDIVLGRCTGLQVWINQPPCFADVVGGNDMVDIDDLFGLLSAWGSGDPQFDIAPPPPPPPGGDGVVNIDDLFMILSAWGPCP